MELIQKLLAATSFKNAFFVLLSTASQFFLPIGNYIIIISILLVFDFITGVQAARKRGEKITSEGWRRTATKIWIYAMSIILTHYIRITMLSTSVELDLAKYISCFLISTELKSLDENIESITGVSILSKVIKALKPLIK
ncbi:hypothetical protein GOQ04_03375 [Emticicia sp. ODNR4P]|nr:hypothetical protein [Emticicia sp. ODNR4P]